MAADVLTTRRAAGAALWAPALDRNAPLPLSRQLAAALRAAIAEGQLGAGARLPSTRVLAAELGLARSTVVAVFEQLAAEGYIAAQPGSGYFVPAGFAAGDVTADPGGREEKPGPAARTISRPGSRPVSQHGAALRELIIEARSSPRPFQSGHADIDPRLVATWKRLASRALSGRSRLNWDYGDPQGEPVLRQAIADYLAAARGVRCRPEQIVLTSGTQQGLSLAARVLLDAGDAAWVEDPCYRAALDILRDAGARIVPVAVDEHGLEIAAAPQDGTPPRLVYTTPSRQYPLGMAMPLARRMALLAWAEAAGAWIVEDDYESEFQKPAQMLPSLQGLDRAGRVIYLGTFSKLVFPALRLGYAVLPEDLVRPFTAARHLADRQSSSLLQGIMTEFMLGGHFARHLKLMRQVYAERQQFLIGAAARRLGGMLDMRPQGCGMYLTAGLPEGWSDRAVAARLAEAGIVALPLSTLTLAMPRPPALVLGYAGHSEAAIERAIERMAAVLA
ncbi:MAG: PLP-dependent aminotransferase family protein [Alphaproteobacteria bacterium]|nr:PLP-dependent aminotransferase family protein [Alphaproteobacteria bacterium]